VDRDDSKPVNRNARKNERRARFRRILAIEIPLDGLPEAMTAMGLLAPTAQDDDAALAVAVAEYLMRSLPPRHREYIAELEADHIETITRNSAKPKRELASGLASVPMGKRRR
jgi:hypothetical protein